MAKVHFAPYSAIKYTGRKNKEFGYSLARPEPILSCGDIVIVDEATAHNLVRNPFEEFVGVQSIAFKSKDIRELESHEETLAALKEDNAKLGKMLEEASEDLSVHKEELENQRSETAKVEDELENVRKELAKCEKEKGDLYNEKLSLIQENAEVKKSLELNKKAVKPKK